MKTFDYHTLLQKVLTPEIVKLLTAIHELKGRQDVLITQRPAVLTGLMKVALIQSTGASNRIEGIETTDKRLREIVAEKVSPRNRDEREIAGYREVLSLIHENHAYIEPTPGVFLQLHRQLYSFSGDNAGGSWKNSDNVISEVGPDGQARVRFRPASAWQTPEAIAQLCTAFSDAWNNPLSDRLVLSAQMVLDFLCIHPFNDGNGRMSRLLTLLLFYRAGYTVGKYISIEKIIEDSKATYYEALEGSSRGWHDCANDYEPFVRYLLGILLKACRELDARTELLLGNPKSKPERIAEWVGQQIKPFRKQDILEALPGISGTTVERALASLLKSGAICKHGGGAGTTYTTTREKF